MNALVNAIACPIRLQVLEILLEGPPMTGRAIHREILNAGGSRSLGRIQRALLELETEGMIEKRSVPGSRAYLYTAPREHPILRRILIPLLQMGRIQPGSDPAEALRLWIAPDAGEMQIYGACLRRIDPEGPLKLHYMLVTGHTEPEAAERWLMNTVDFVGRSLDRAITIERETFQGLREKAADPEFRDAVLDHGIQIAGLSLRPMAIPTY